MLMVLLLFVSCCTVSVEVCDARAEAEVTAGAGGCGWDRDGGRGDDSMGAGVPDLWVFGGSR